MSERGAEVIDEVDLKVTLLGEMMVQMKAHRLQFVLICFVLFWFLLFFHLLG